MNERISPLEAFYDLLSPIGLKEAGLKRYNLIETALNDYDFVKHYIPALRTGEFIIVGKYDDMEKDKKIKALEIIKENLVVSCDESNNDKPCLMLGVKVDKDKLVIIYETFDREKIDLLKEALL